MRKKILFFLLIYFVPIHFYANIDKIKIIKIGYVDIQRVLQNISDGKKALDLLKTQRDQYQNSKTQMENEVKRLEKELETRVKELSEMQVRDYLAQIENKRYELEMFINNANRDLEKKEKEMLTPIYQKILETIKNEMGKMGYNMILDSRYVLVADPELDLTDTLIKLIEGK